MTSRKSMRITFPEKQWLVKFRKENAIWKSYNLAYVLQPSWNINNLLDTCLLSTVTLTFLFKNQTMNISGLTNVSSLQQRPNMTKG